MLGKFSFRHIGYSFLAAGCDWVFLCPPVGYESYQSDAFPRD